MARPRKNEGDARARLLPLPSVTFTDVEVAGTAPGEPAMTVETLQKTLRDNGFDPQLVQLAPEADGEGLAKTLAERDEVKIVDYTGGPGFGGWLEREGAAVDARAWCTAAQTAFLDGYADVGPDPRESGALLDAFVLDKALYEVVYEARNRPTWLGLPTDAIDRLLQEARS